MTSELRRGPAPLLAGAALVISLASCASTVQGRAAYGGSGAPTTTTTTTAPSEPTRTTDPTPSPSELTTAPTSSSPELTTDESLACLFIPTSDVDAFNQFTALAEKPEADQTQDGRDTVAAAFDSAATEVQTYIDPLVPGPVRDAAQAYHDAQIAVRDGLTSGSDVTTQTILDAQAALDTACGT